MATQFIDGSVYYPDWLPCPQLDTDLKPRERRYISDIGEVKKLRRFQSAFQATRQTIAFVFTPEQARDFQEWYKDGIIDGGAWFYADWPILHKETRIAYRFVTRPVWTFLALGNCRVSATVELYERKVGKVANVYTSKLYPLLPSDDLCSDLSHWRANLETEFTDRISAGIARFSAVMSGYIYSDYYLIDDIQQRLPTFTARGSEFIYSDCYMRDDVTIRPPTFIAAINKWLITYDFYKEDSITNSIPTIISGEMS